MGPRGGASFRGRAFGILDSREMKLKWRTLCIISIIIIMQTACDSWKKLMSSGGLGRTSVSIRIICS